MRSEPALIPQQIGREPLGVTERTRFYVTPAGVTPVSDLFPGTSGRTTPTLPFVHPLLIDGGGLIGDGNGLPVATIDRQRRGWALIRRTHRRPRQHVGSHLARGNRDGDQASLIRQARAVHEAKLTPVDVLLVYPEFPLVIERRVACQYERLGGMSQRVAGRRLRWRGCEDRQGRDGQTENNQRRCEGFHLDSSAFAAEIARGLPNTWPERILGANAKCAMERLLCPRGAHRGHRLYRY